MSAENLNLPDNLLPAFATVRLVSRTRQCLKQMLELPEGEMPSPTTTQFIRNGSIVVSAENPNNFDSDRLPAVSYEFGILTADDTFVRDVRQIGENLAIQLNVVFENFDTYLDKRDNQVKPFYDSLLETSAHVTDCIRSAAIGLKTSPDSPFYGIADTRLVIGESFSEGFSDRQFIQYAIGIDWYMPKVGEN